MIRCQNMICLNARCRMSVGRRPNASCGAKLQRILLEKSICGCHDDHVCLRIGTLTVSDADRLNPEVGTLILCALCVAQHSSQVQVGIKFYHLTSRRLVLYWYFDFLNPEVLKL